MQWLEEALTSHHNPILNQPEIEWTMLPTLHGGSGDSYEVAPLMAPKTITLWARTLLLRGERLKVVE